MIRVGIKIVGLVDVKLAQTASFLYEGSLGGR